MDIKKHTSANSWYSAMRGEGYEVPIILLQSIEKIMKVKKNTFPEAYQILEDEKRISIKDKVVSFK